MNLTVSPDYTLLVREECICLIIFGKLILIQNVFINIWYKLLKSIN